MSIDKLPWRLDPETLLRGAHRLCRGKRIFKGNPLWDFVSEVTGHGSTYSAEICRHFGWNPDAPISEPLPPRTAKLKL